MLLHGLTFDRRMWDPIIEALPPSHSVLALDLPGHGDSPALGSHHLDVVVDAIHQAVLAADLDAPILVGHSIGAALAGTYVTRYPAAAFVNVDSPIRIEPFARLVRSLAPELCGDGFPRVWKSFHDSMHTELVPDPAGSLVRAGDAVVPELVLSYWAQLIEQSVEETVRWTEQQLSQACAAAIPYLGLCGAPVDPAERAWVQERLPHGEIVVWPVGHHFPHLAHPDRFAALLTGLVAGLPPLPDAQPTRSERR